MPGHKISWYEVWADDGLTPPYVLTVMGLADSGVRVFDPLEGKFVYEAESYEAVKLWLLEDEYSRVAGRMTIDR
jgi:hypothetical protein